ncbi:DUF4019 domain-containing protein [Rhizobium sp. G187]|uniref:DUF4019 domain-containing protein n=1 Tax=Rhizobium sp. G187 TaxID=3451352 RepID=UPI003EE4524F
MIPASCRLLKFLLLGIVVMSPATTHARETVAHEAHQRVVKVHSIYFQLREMGAYERAYMLLTDGQKIQVSLAQFGSQWAALRERYGRLTHLRISKVTWYRNPMDAKPGLYAAVDYRASFERLKDFCGLVVWSVGEGYKVQREEMIFLADDPKRPKSGPAEDRALKTLPCNSP